MEQPQTHCDNAHGVNRHQDVFVPRWLNLLGGVSPDQRDLPFAQPRQTGRMPPGRREAADSPASCRTRP
jgi:hypothetical protein